MKPDIAAIGLGRGITITASELCNGPTLHEFVTGLIVINEAGDTLEHFLQNLALPSTKAGVCGIVVGLRAFEARDWMILCLPPAFCRF